MPTFQSLIQDTFLGSAGNKKEKIWRCTWWGNVKNNASLIFHDGVKKVRMLCNRW